MSPIPPLRAASLASLLSLLSGCGGNEAPAPVAPASDPAPPATTASAAADTLVLTFSTDEPTVGSEVGERRLGVGTTTTGRAGWLLFGPYAPLPAGRYRVEIQGMAQSGHAGVVYVDVARDKGATVVAAANFDATQLAAPASTDGWIVLPFELAQPATDIEVRLRVTDASRVSVSGYTLRSIP